MTAADCLSPLDDDALIAYWLGELGEAAEARIDEHVLGCDACSGRLAQVVALADGIRAAFAKGVVRAFVTPSFVRRAIEAGMRVREYRIPHNGSVNCSVAPDDQLLVAHLEAPLANVTRIDAQSYLDDAPVHVFRDVPFDAASGELVLVPKLADVRTMPSHRQRVRLVAVDAAGERVLGDYTFNHAAGGPA
ncbi:MAG TPA: zf-HC2 domain-containing protein [Casimicrobiaceae bacterium]|nr:zf-HC2 domain-containing protein [Casimicrobiaceae bacterium]